MTITADEGADIYYTLDGNEPTTSSTKYAEPVEIPAQTTTLKAIAVKDGETSKVAEATYTFEVKKPVITEEDKTFYDPFTTTITADEGAKIYYTLNGDTPTTESTEYTNGVEIPAKTTTLKAIAVKYGQSSEVVEATYTFKVETPVISEASKKFSEPFTTTISAAEGAKIYYTLNGDAPTAESTEYTDAITISETTTLKAIAVKYEQSSEVAEATYTVANDGSYEHPYTPEEVSGNSSFNGKTIWVKGSIAGWCNGNYKVSELSNRATNIALGTDKKFIAIKLAAGAARDYIQKNSASLTGTEIMFYGKVAKYFSKNGQMGEGSIAFAGTEENPIATLSVKTDEGYATFVSDYPFYVPEGAECGTVTAAKDNTLTINYKYQPGYDDTNVVPANYPVLVKTDGKKTYNLALASARSGSSAGTNLLRAGTGSTFTAEANTLYYKLAYDDYEARTDLGFYWGAADGGAFSVPEGLTYLAVPVTAQTTSVKSYLFKDAVTGIGEATTTADNAPKAVYTIDGHRVSDTEHLGKGLYIVNGKKVIIK